VGRRVRIGAGDHAAECWQARLARRGATRRSVVHGGRAGEAAGGAQVRRLASCGGVMQPRTAAVAKWGASAVDAR